MVSKIIKLKIYKRFRLKLMPYIKFLKILKSLMLLSNVRLAVLTLKFRFFDKDSLLKGNLYVAFSIIGRLTVKGYKIFYSSYKDQESNFSLAEFWMKNLHQNILKHRLNSNRSKAFKFQYRIIGLENIESSLVKSRNIVFVSTHSGSNLDQLFLINHLKGKSLICFGEASFENESGTLKIFDSRDVFSFLKYKKLLQMGTPGLIAIDGTFGKKNILVKMFNEEILFSGGYERLVKEVDLDSFPVVSFFEDDGSSICIVIGKLLYEGRNKNKLTSSELYQEPLDFFQITAKRYSVSIVDTGVLGYENIP